MVANVSRYIVIGQEVILLSCRIGRFSTSNRYSLPILSDKIRAMSNSVQPILDKALAGERLTTEDCTALLESNDFVRIGLAADEIRKRKNPGDVVTYIIDRNINYTNVCNVVCTFCAFYRRPGKPDTYVHSIEEI